MFHLKRYLTLCIFVLTSGLISLAAMPSQAQLPVGVILETSQPGHAIPSDFLGLSFEMQQVLPDTNGGHFFSPTNQALIATFKMLGIKNLRVGGNTADRPTLPVPNHADADELFAFARAADVKVIYTLRLKQSTPAAAAELANYIEQHYASQLDSFAIGNEPNVFSTNYSIYLAEWKRFAAEITALSNSPSARFCGPSVSPGRVKWSALFANDLASSGWLKFIAQHDYPGGDARKATNPAIAQNKILSPDMDAFYAKFAANFMPAAATNGLACRFEEANNFYNGGALDISDTFAAALWALNYQWWWAAHGLVGINFHTGDKVAAGDKNNPCRYATFWTVADGYNVHPIGYAEKLFSLGSQGQMIPVIIRPTSTNNLNFAAYAIRGEDGNFYVTLINKSHDTTAINLSVQIGAPEIKGWTKGEVIRLLSPDGDTTRKHGVTLGGAEITDQSAWHGQWQEIIVPRQKGQFALMVPLPAASAAVVKLTPN